MTRRSPLVVVRALLSKVRRNVHLPDSGKWNTSTARFTFPVSKLSQDKEEAGVVKIPEPGRDEDNSR